LRDAAQQRKPALRLVRVERDDALSCEIERVRLVNLQAGGAEKPCCRGGWIVPWQRMKRGRRRIKADKTNHYVYLPRQARSLLLELHALMGRGKYLFPNMRDPDRPMDNNALLKAIDRMGYNGDLTGHGFRALATPSCTPKLSGTALARSCRVRTCRAMDSAVRGHA
jgi:integrase